MIVQVWPPYMPQTPVKDGASFGSPVNAIIRTGMDVGPDKSRPRTTAAIETMRLVFRTIPTADLVAFKSWHRNSLAMGALAFSFTDPIGGQPITVRFASDNGHYTPVPLGGGKWQLTVNFEVLP